MFQEVSAVLLSVTRAKDFAKELQNIIEKSKDIETRKIILDLLSQLNDTYSDTLKLKEKIIELEEENKSLQEKLNLKEEVIIESGACYKKEDTERKNPYCEACFVSTSKLFPLVRKEYDAEMTRALGNSKCSKCRQHFHIREESKA